MKTHGSKNGIKYGMVIDLDKCTGCGTCSVACMTENNVYVLKDESDKIRSIAWMRVYRIENGQPYGKTKVSYMPRPCMHCDHHTPCVSVCPATATSKDEIGGIVSQIPTRCIGCRYCMAACPYHARYFNWFDPWPDFAEWVMPLYKGPHVKQMTQGLNPEVAPRMRGVVEKCTFCHHRLMAAKNQAYAEDSHEIPEEAYQPACAQACPAGAITFGNLNNPKHKVHELSKSPRAFRLLEKLGTDPKVYYLSSQDWIREKADNYLNVPKGTGY